MHIQPYFPEPVTVKGNVADERYGTTLGFIRSVMAGHLLTVGVVVAVAVVFEPPFGLAQAAYVFLAGLVALTLVRRGARHGAIENVLSVVLLVPTLLALGTVAGLFLDSGQPVWIVLASYIGAFVYSLLCGRDFSFVGQFVLTTYATVALLAVAVALGAVSLAEAWFWGLIALSVVLFYVYDLAALLSRRRLGEEPAAVADLYRDLLNFVTYSVRVALHWRRFRFL